MLTVKLIKLYTHIIIYILTPVCTKSVDNMGHAVYVYYIYNIYFIYIIIYIYIYSV